MSCYYALVKYTKQSNDIYDGSWHLEDWDISDDYNPPLPDLWDDLTGTYSAKESGTTEAKVDLRDKDDKEKEVTLYVHLVRRIKEANPTGAIIIQQSQISKAIRTNDAVIGGKFGNYRFAMTVGDYAETHTSYYHDYCCQSSETHDCGHCHGHTCKMNMPGNWGDDKVNFNFDLTSSQDELEIKKGVNQNTNPQVYGHSGGAVDALDPGQNYPETVPSLKASANKYYYTSNGKDAKGAEYVTILWRGTSKDNYKDIPTLAKFKESDVKLTFGSADNYNIPKDMLASAGSQPNRKTNQKRASTYLVTDLEATSSCSKVDTRKTVLDLFFGNGVALAMPFPRFVSRSTGTQGVFPQGHRICQSAVPCVRLKFPAYGRKLLSPCHSVRRVSVRPCRDTHAPC